MQFMKRRSHVTCVFFPTAYVCLSSNIFGSVFIVYKCRAGLVVRCRPRRRRVPGSKPDSIEDPSCLGPFHAKSYVYASYVWGQTSSACCCAKFREGVANSGAVLYLTWAPNIYDY
ncbi:hypothetical protein AVEN_53406-1 [Araneus ventricosus]|uniref:Uncharacterized protein n=1 Tax=Araneus ventricosus TaxID=182803 RepID=A0A4Y2AA94_ARAVE|nr:hypothetical protein AVEN_53406-1 [Araneus ventricosus]